MKKRCYCAERPAKTHNLHKALRLRVNTFGCREPLYADGCEECALRKTAAKQLAEKRDASRSHDRLPWLYELRTFSWALLGWCVLSGISDSKTMGDTRGGGVVRERR